MLKLPVSAMKFICNRKIVCTSDQSAQIRCVISNMYMQVTVLRDGEVKDISIFDLLVGDVMLFETGDIIPADGVIITGNTIR